MDSVEQQKRLYQYSTKIVFYLWTAAMFFSKEKEEQGVEQLSRVMETMNEIVDRHGLEFAKLVAQSVDKKMDGMDTSMAGFAPPSLN